MTKYSLPAMTRRLLRLAAPVKGKLAVPSSAIRSADWNSMAPASSL